MGREARRKTAPVPAGPMPKPQPQPAAMTEKDKATQAVQQLDAIISKMNMPRETHAACQAAAQFLLEFIYKA